MIGMEDGVFPHMRSIEAGDIEEERRLCYVGVTRAMRSLYLTHARTRAMYGGREWNVPSRFLAEIPVELTDQEEAAAAPSITSWSQGGTGAPAPAPRNEGATFTVGDDVVHATFGEGIVIGADAGGIVIVRFRGDGSERKLMADYAPLKKA
jgi:DNA helicase-2/ATP-dependent DNA helicase PcrA